MIKILLTLFIILNIGFPSTSQVAPAQFAIVIDEIMADPTPITGLPDVEWIELKNISGADINLQGWRIGKLSAQSSPMPTYLLKADSFVVVCSGSAVTAMSPFAPTIPVTSFPSLSNGGDLIYLKSPQGRIIHSVNYSDDWYKNDLKRSGGWSLEMIDTKNPCSGLFNWTASADSRGGTPGKKNAVTAVNPDVNPPKLLRASAADSLHVFLIFNEPLDSMGSSATVNYSISDGISIVSATPLAFQFDRVQLRLNTPLLRNKIYTVTSSKSKDCAGNALSNSASQTRVGLAERLDSLDVVVNEILFNPKADGADYVELFNRSNKMVNLRNLYVANRGTGGAVSSVTPVSTEDYLFFPGDFMVLTEDIAAVKAGFVTVNPDAFIQLPSLPSYNDDKGSVVTLNEQGRIIDEVNYSEKWHFKLISNAEGISLERIDYNEPSNDPSNWHSAAANINYGTPTYKNSQLHINEDVRGEVTVRPKVFSPDNDGNDDFATIQYAFPQAGYVANITIFDAAGRPIRYLQRNALSGATGLYRWDGLDDRNKQLPVGLYIIYTEIYNLEGKTKRFKSTVVLGRKN